VSVVVSRPSGTKCGRCWRYLEIRENGLCKRCDDVVKEEFPDSVSTEK